MENLSLGEKLSILRTRKKITKIALSELTGIHKATIGKYEHNQMQPSIDAIVKLAQALNISIDYLLIKNYEEKNTTTITDKELLSLAEKIDTLAENEKAKLKNIIKSYIGE